MNKLAEFTLTVERGPSQLEGMAAENAEPGATGTDFTQIKLDETDNLISAPVILNEGDSIILTGNGYKIKVQVLPYD